ncbi:MAG: PAS domain S-box protein [Burkholderiaceae bacterium]|nr:PAS domain S-box protein [Burkholderiaceae bacterium]
MDFLTSFFGRSGFLPHGYCFTWSPALLWSMVGADSVIALAYFSIPVAMMSFVRKRGDFALNWVAWLFIAFIFSCGITHVMDIWTIWRPDYGLQVLTKGFTAGVSIVTAFALWPLIPKLLRIPSVSQLQSVIGTLESEVRKRRSAEEQLVEIQQSLAVTLASIGAGFIATDRDGRVTRMNAIAEQITGWPQDEAHGQLLWAVFHREDRPASFLQRNPVDVMIEQGVTIETVHRIFSVSRLGVRLPLEVKSALTHADDGAVLGVAMVFRDMSATIRAEADSSRLAAIVESSNDAIVGKTLDGRITSWNNAAQEMFGYSADEAIGQSVQMLIPPDRADEEMRIVANLATGELMSQFDTVRVAKDGRLLDVSITISPIRDGEGRIVGASKIARDVTSQRRAEAALRDSEARLRFTLESAEIGDWDLDLTTGLAKRSLRHDRCFGYERPVPAWTFDTFIEHVHADDRDEVAHSLHVAITESQPWHAQCRVIWPDGSIHWISLHGKVQAQEGMSTRMLGIVTEITQQRLAEDVRLKAQRLEAENRQIQEANRLKSQFLANMSHELRTPLNAVIGFADLLQSNAVPVDSPKRAEFLGHIATSGRHLLQLINDVLDLSKVESGKFEFFPEPVQLPVLLKEVTDVLHTATQRKQIVIGLQIEPGLTDLVLDAARLKQVLYNYLSNAIKFTAQGGWVTVRAMAQGGRHFRIEVEDTGIGISPTDVSRLFVEFQQLDAGYSKQHQGTGLGLALTRRLVEAQGGSVGVRSTLGAGSVFHVVLNRVHGTDAEGTDAQGTGNVTNDEASAHPNRLLVIADDQHGRERMVRALSDAGFHVDAASTGEQALSVARATPYRAITLDLVLPDQRGLDLLSGIRKEGASRESPVVGVSMPADSERAANFAIADVLCKPIRSDEVLLAMSRFRAAGSGRTNVMVVDDDPLALDLMQATLKSIGIDAVCLLDGREALRDLEFHQPDALILDLMMPGFDGFEVLDALHRMPAWRELPVFIWTSMILTDAEYASLAASAHAILNKGGGGMSFLLDSIRRHHSAAVASTGLGQT